MSDYLLIAARDPFDYRAVDGFYDLAGDLARAGNKVTLFLVQNGVLPARAGTDPDRLAKVVATGVEVLADEFSLRERAIPAQGLIKGVKTAPIDSVIDRLAQGAKALWN